MPISSRARKPRSCANFAEIVCRFRRLEFVGDRLRFEKSSPRWRITGERGDRGVEEGSTKIENQRSKMVHWSRPDCIHGRPPGRPVEEAGRPLGRPACTSEHRKERSTGPVDRLKAGQSRLGAVDRADRLWHGSVDRPVDRQARLTFLLGFEFLFWMGLNQT